MTRLETPAYYDGAFQGMEEEVRELRSLLASCGDFRLEQWRNLVRDYDCAYKLAQQQAQEIERLKWALTGLLIAIESQDYYNDKVIDAARAALGGGR